ncbi:MAG: isoprenylcysteine carboxyl methyltransferase [Burkholderia sp.]|nr:isoprenylcysteine carboxyl methyltransferase [Burkholderia sp.]
MPRTHCIEQDRQAAERQAETLNIPAAPSARSLAVESRRCLGSYAASMAVILAGVYFYTALSPYFVALYRLSWRPMLGSHAASFAIDFALVLWSSAALYGLLLLPYYALRRGRWSNAWTLASCLWRHCFRRAGRQPVSAQEKQAMLCLLLKFIFIPFCLHGLFAYLAFINDRLIGMPDGFAHQNLLALYNDHLHVLILNVLFLIDFLPFVIGYLVQARTLDNEVVSVDTSVGGWVACLACYPPFNGAMVLLLPWQVVEQVPVTSGPSAAAHMLVNGTLLLFFACYAWTSVSLGFKCSNLMHRGIVHSGLYRKIRHPAYLFKNLAWWTGALPMLIGLAQTSAREFFWTLFCMAGWSGIYLLRALCEERHLAHHADYRAYMQQVRYRFLPGVF